MGAFVVEVGANGAAGSWMKSPVLGWPQRVIWPIRDVSAEDRENEFMQKAGITRVAFLVVSRGGQPRFECGPSHTEWGS